MDHLRGKSRISASQFGGLTPAQIRKAIYGESAKGQTNTKVKKVNVLSKPEKLHRVHQINDLSVLLNSTFSTSHCVGQYTTPDWFTYKGKPEISVVVPIYDTDASELIGSWDSGNDGFQIEVIFVDDNCPNNSKDRVLANWEAKGVKSPVGSIYRSSIHQGWSACCNIGAEKSNAEIVIFVHPNSTLKSGWIKPLTRLFRKPDVGVVAGIQVEQGTNRIVDAGSEWHWSAEDFLKIGREIYNGAKVSVPFDLGNIPAEMLEAKDCEKVSSHFMAVRRNEFRNLGGFNANLCSASWADADLCSFYREKGLRVILQPNSVSYRDGLDTTDRHASRGRVFFANKWTVPGRLDAITTNRRSDRKPVESILIRRRAAHGDVLVAMSVAAALKKKHPGCKIIFNTDVPEIANGNPWIDRVVEVQSERLFDHYIDLDMSYEYRPFTNFLDSFADAAGVSPQDCEFFLAKEPVEEELPSKYAVIHAGQTLWAGRNWSNIKFDTIAKKLKSCGYNIICVGTSSDYRPVVSDIDLRGHTTVGQLATVIERSSLFVGVDSFPMLIAQLFNVPGVATFGSIKPETRLFPNSSIRPVVANALRCLGCHHRNPTPCTATMYCEVGVQECMNGISAETMWNIIDRMI